MWWKDLENIIFYKFLYKPITRIKTFPTEKKLLMFLNVAKSFGNKPEAIILLFNVYILAKYLDNDQHFLIVFNLVWLRNAGCWEVNWLKFSSIKFPLLPHKKCHDGDNARNCKQIIISLGLILIATKCKMKWSQYKIKTRHFKDRDGLGFCG